MERVAAQRREVLPLLLLAPLVRDRERERGGCQRGHRQRRVAPGQLLEHERVGHLRARLAAAPDGLRELRRDEPELGALGQELVGHAGHFVGLARERAERLLGELVHRLADEVLLFGGLEGDHDPSSSLRPEDGTWWK